MAGDCFKCHRRPSVHPLLTLYCLYANAHAQLFFISSLNCCHPPPRSTFLCQCAVWMCLMGCLLAPAHTGKLKRHILHQLNSSTGLRHFSLCQWTLPNELFFRSHPFSSLSSLFIFPHFLVQMDLSSLSVCILYSWWEMCIRCCGLRTRSINVFLILIDHRQHLKLSI